MDIGFFRSKCKLSSFAGVIPGARNSDQKICDASLKKDSNQYLRWFLTEACTKAIRVVTSLGTFVCAGLRRQRYPDGCGVLAAVTRVHGRSMISWFQSASQYVLALSQSGLYCNWFSVTVLATSLPNASNPRRFLRPVHLFVGHLLYSTTPPFQCMMS